MLLKFMQLVYALTYVSPFQLYSGLFLCGVGVIGLFVIVRYFACLVLVDPWVVYPPHIIVHSHRTHPLSWVSESISLFLSVCVS